MTVQQSERRDGPPGSVLREARIAAGKSVTDTAEALNLLKSYVEALESNDYSRFNSPLFARGYIKAYARYMDLDEAPLLRDCDRICRRDDERSSRHVSAQNRAKAPGNAGLIAALIIALVIWVVSVWIFTEGPQEQHDVASAVLSQPMYGRASVSDSTRREANLMATKPVGAA